MPFAEGTARGWLRGEKAAPSAAPALCRGGMQPGQSPKDGDLGQKRAVCGVPHWCAGRKHRGRRMERGARGTAEPAGRKRWSPALPVLSHPLFPKRKIFNEKKQTNRRHILFVAGREPRC